MRRKIILMVGALIGALFGVTLTVADTVEAGPGPVIVHGNSLSRTGGTLTGDLYMPGYSIYNDADTRIDISTADNIYFRVGGSGADMRIASTDIYVAAQLHADGTLDIGSPLVYTPVTISADDATPAVSGGSLFFTSDNSAPTAISDLDSPSTGQVLTICVGGTGANASTIADAGNFNLSAAWNPGLDDCITLYVQADNDYLELSRSDN